MMTSRKTRSRFKAWANFAARFIAVVLISTFLVLSEDQRAAIAQALADPLSILSGRSPGARAHAALRQTKVRHHAALPKGENLLSEARVIDEEDLSREPGFFAENEPGPPMPDMKLPVGGKPAPGAPPTPTQGGGGSGGSKFFGGTGGGGVLGGGGGGAGGGGSQSGQGGDETPICVDGNPCHGNPIVPAGDPTPPPTIVGVPEPETWAMVLIGFFVLGGVMRARRLRAARPGNTLAREPRRD